MDKNVVAVDLDDTIHEYSHTLALVALNEFGVKINTEPREWKDALLPVTDPALATKIFQKCHDKEYIFLTKPYPWAAEGLKEIQKLGFDIKYFTDRKTESHNNTYEWLVYYGFPSPDNLNCCVDKRQNLLEIKDQVATVIDDRPRTLQFAQVHLGCSDVFSIKHTTNQNLSDMDGIHLTDSWSDLVAVFKEIML